MANLSTEPDEIKRRLTDPWLVVSHLGLSDGARRQARGVMVRCPWHSERTPSCSVSVGPDETLRAHCFGCGRGGDVLSLVAAVRGLDERCGFVAVLQEAAALLGQDAGRSMPPRRSLPSTRPPVEEVRALWSAALPVCEVPELARRLLARRLDPATLTDLDLARALPPGATLPRWATCAGRSWAESGHSLLVPLRSADGSLVSLHARAIGGSVEPKGLSPAGHSAAGLVMACPFAEQILRGGLPQWWCRSEPPTVIVCEGVPDFLTNAAHFGEWEHAPATLGILSGAWSLDVAARIPDGWRVLVRTHGDAAGRKYREQIAESLCSRCRVEVPREQAA